MSEDKKEGVASDTTTTEPKKVYCCPGYEALFHSRRQMHPHLRHWERVGCTCGEKGYHYEGEGFCRNCGDEQLSVTKVNLVTGETSQSVECHCDNPYTDYYYY